MNAPLFAQPIRSAMSSSRDPDVAARELADTLVHSELGFVLFFCSAEYDLEALSLSLEAAFDGIRLAGCTTAGELTPRGYDQGTITALGFDRNLFAIEVGLVEALDDFSLTQAQTLIDGLVAGCRDLHVAPTKGHTFALTLLDGLSSQEELVLLNLDSVLGSIPHFGGSAGDDIHLTGTHVYHAGQFRTRAAVVIMVNTPLDFEVFTTHHMRSLEQKLIVTDADPATRTVYELNAEPAALEYARQLGLDPDQLDYRVFALNPLAVRIGQEYYVRSIQKVNPDLSLTFYCAVENGIVLTAMQPDAMLDNLAHRFERIEQTLGEPMITIGCDCFLRRLEAEYTRRTDETSDFLVKHNVIGFNTYGEQYDGMHLNQTFTGVVIGRSAHDY
ncbi:nitric oxide-sensing protein NosP [Marinobacterium weihaiense]|uniref:FIST C-terminal domain-containing protein n=1 Tax=Marinobacterium weihaiense TaxID=2851016 RepID=A0ABS6M7U6_9GAMM|nr:nitric oxide-sensing protein NosP [Marinobacterium weihaiense]MBV0931862.1 FIST C-terminal domain-containing protein [Marinobacterium weihaiense]